MFMTPLSAAPIARCPSQRHILLRNAIIFIAACAYLASGNAAFSLKDLGKANSAAVVQTEQVRAELVAHAPDGVAPGKTVWVGLQLQHQPHWHTYWKNPGDSGLPTTLQWTVPTGVTAGDIAWPTPQRIAVGNLANYGYEGTVLLPVPLTMAPTWAPGAGADAVDIQLHASWLVCRQECIPQEGRFTLQLPVRGSTATHGTDFDAARAAAPLPFSGVLSATPDSNTLLLRATGLPAAWQGKALNGFPETTNVLDAPRTPQASDAVRTSAGPTPQGTQTWNQGVWSARIPLSPQRDTSPTTLPVVLALGTHSLRAVAQVDGTWPPVVGVTGVAAIPPALQAALDANANASTNSSASGATSDAAPQASTPPAAAAATTPDGSWFLALAAALLGGLILNLMPCVLPVLAIKIMGLVRHGNHSRASQRAQGTAYTLGVVLSFMAIGGLMLALRATGEQLGWGFQLQSPAVVAGLAALFTLLALNLIGVFDVGHLLPSRLAALQAHHPVADSFLTGILAVAVASPCTAPFMGASLGYAIALPAPQALGIFAALGLGLALPFLAASWVPAVAHWLPRPGAWMDTLRHFMAFPMLATVVWLVWVLGHLTSIDGAASLLMLLLALALVVWSLGSRRHRHWLLATFSIAALALLAGAIGQNVLQMEPAQTHTADTPPGATPGTTGTAPAGAWHAWTPGRVDAELRAGHPVFVDFTAAWCITCQYNKKTTLANPDVLADFQTRQVTLLRADWTRRDPAITQALEQLGRSGVPVYVLYRNGHAPVVFSEILQVKALREALARL